MYQRTCVNIIYIKGSVCFLARKESSVEKELKTVKTKLISLAQKKWAC